MTDLPFNYKYIWRLEKSVFLSTHARQADYSQVVCVFLFPPYSLHVWDTVLPDCLGMGWDGLRVCAVAHYLLQNRLLLWSGEPGEWQRKPLKDSAALHGDATVCMCVCAREYCQVIPSLFAAKWQAFAWRPSVPLPVSPLDCIGLTDTVVGHTERHVDTRWDLCCSLLRLQT